MQLATSSTAGPQQAARPSSSAKYLAEIRQQKHRWRPGSERKTADAAVPPSSTHEGERRSMESGAKWTAGPWVVSTGHANNYRAEILGQPGARGAKRVVARIPTPSGQADCAKSNALLVAAAPEMAQALQWCLNEIDMRCDASIPSVKQATDAARAALAKAEGK